MQPQIPDSCLCEILRLLNPNIQSTTIVVSRRFAHLARAELYRTVEVAGDRTQMFFSALKSRRELGALVTKLVLVGIEYEGDRDGLRKHFNIPGRLQDLLYWPAICDGAIDFLISQPHITSAFFGDLNLAANIPSLLPHLTDIAAPPEDLNIIVPSRPVKDIEFHYSEGDQIRRPIISLKFLSLSSAPILSLELQISQLVAAAEEVPALHTLLPDIRRLVIYQDQSWGSAFCSRCEFLTFYINFVEAPWFIQLQDNFNESIDTMVAIVDQLSTMRHLVIACTYGITQARLIRRKFVRGSRLDLDLQVIGTRKSPPLLD
ncbi:hypothetical protein R3P38DRAFT_3176603 [Favolaschia claudopus]|uniref:F-box domain-containing protein n=1 Tax=Favolaschia claudopus TaxID=2862362 RepID=A0AAW0CYJ3_9AGAR